jgi:UDP-3-O-[3-hydroxymyristoyl] N-acetylglucosamine deacetylase
VVRRVERLSEPGVEQLREPGVERLSEIFVEGVGLHSGAPARVTLRRRSGPVTLAAGGLEARIDQLVVGSTARATTVEAHDGSLRVGTVEHLFAALAGLGLYEGLALSVDGPEMPLLDGGSAAWCASIDRLAVAPSAPLLRVARAAALDVGASRYEFTPAAGVEVEVRLELDGFDEARVASEARWGGGADDFRLRIATARTFVLARDIGDLVAGGLARHVDPASVVVLAPEAILHAGRAFRPDEPARHKLLDLLGDLYLSGGPPLGRLRAVRPGHAANAVAMQRARAEGIVLAD